MNILTHEIALPNDQCNNVTDLENSLTNNKLKFLINVMVQNSKHKCEYLTCKSCHKYSITST